MKNSEICNVGVWLTAWFQKACHKTGFSVNLVVNFSVKKKSVSTLALLCPSPKWGFMTPKLFLKFMLLWFCSKEDVGKSFSPIKCVRNIRTSYNVLLYHLRNRNNMRLLVIFSYRYILVFWETKKMTLPLQEFYLLCSLTFSF